MAKIEEIVARNIFRHRKERLKLTQARAAELCNVPMRTYVRAEDYDNPAMPSIPTLEAIARGFGIEPVELFREMSRPAPITKAQALKEIAKAAGIRIEGDVFEDPPLNVPDERREFLLALARLPDDQFEEVSATVRTFLESFTSPRSPAKPAVKKSKPGA